MKPFFLIRSFCANFFVIILRDIIVLENFLLSFGQSYSRITMCNLHWCYTWIALLSANQNRVFFSCKLLSKWVKWNISVEHEVVFPRLNFLWDDWITLRCFFVVVCLFVFFVFIFAIYFSSSLHILWDVCLWNYIFHPSNSCYFTKCMAFVFAHIQSARPNKASNGHHPLSEAIWLWETK